MRSVHPIEEYDRDRLEREKFLPDVRYLHEEREIMDRSNNKQIDSDDSDESDDFSLNI